MPSILDHIGSQNVKAPSPIITAYHIYRIITSISSRSCSILEIVLFLIWLFWNTEKRECISLQGSRRDKDMGSVISSTSVTPQVWIRAKVYRDKDRKLQSKPRKPRFSDLWETYTCSALRVSSFHLYQGQSSVDQKCHGRDTEITAVDSSVELEKRKWLCGSCRLRRCPRQHLWSLYFTYIDRRGRSY